MIEHTVICFEYIYRYSYMYLQKSKIAAPQLTRTSVRQSSESGALSLSSATRHIDFHLLRRIYVTLVAHSIAFSLHIYSYNIYSRDGLGWARAGPKILGPRAEAGRNGANSKHCITNCNLINESLTLYFQLTK